MSDPTYDRAAIDANPVWRLAFTLSHFLVAGYGLAIRLTGGMGLRIVAEESGLYPIGGLTSFFGGQSCCRNWIIYAVCAAALIQIT